MTTYALIALPVSGIVYAVVAVAAIVARLTSPKEPTE